MEEKVRKRSISRCQRPETVEIRVFGVEIRVFQGQIHEFPGFKIEVKIGSELGQKGSSIELKSRKRDFGSKVETTTTIKICHERETQEKLILFFIDIYFIMTALGAGRLD